MPPSNNQQMIPLANFQATPRRGGNFSRVNPPSADELKQYNPNLPNALEVIWQPFYDYQTYAQAGQTQLLFFQIPQGQSSKTLADTNMDLAGQFPAPTGFLCTGIQVVFMPLNATSQLASAGTRLTTNIDDVIKVGNSGFLQLKIGSKPYMQDAPLGKFPPNFGFDIFAAFGTTGANATTNVGDVNYGRSKGRYAEITPFYIPQSQNFSVSLNWPTAVAITVAGKIGVILDGFYYRLSQ